MVVEWSVRLVKISEALKNAIPNLYNTPIIPSSNRKKHRVSLLGWNGMMLCFLELLDVYFNVCAYFWKFFLSFCIINAHDWSVCDSQYKKKKSAVLTNATSILALEDGDLYILKTGRGSLSFLFSVWNVETIPSWKVIELAFSCISGVQKKRVSFFLTFLPFV